MRSLATRVSFRIQQWIGMDWNYGVLFDSQVNDLRLFFRTSNLPLRIAGLAGTDQFTEYSE
jgi:hypothetical protein